MTGISYLPRLLDSHIAELFSQLPALLLAGPRASGKTTTARRHAKTTIRLDQANQAAALRADVDSALRALTEPVLIDEWQLVPDVLAAVKRAVDDDSRAGRFLLTGSVNADLNTATWPGTGRVVRLPMYGLTMGDITASYMTGNDSFLARLTAGNLEAFAAPPAIPELRDYLEFARNSGFPDAALRLTGRARTAWLQGYIDQLVTRDVPAVSTRRDPVRIRRFVETLALNTAGIISEKTLYTAANVNRETANAYQRLLTDLYLLDSLPAWSTNRLSRLIKAPKRYFVDPGLVLATLGIDVPTVLQDGNLLGRLIDTFALAQLRPQLALLEQPPRMYHLRDKDGAHEIDVVIELGAGSIIALEIKANSSVSVGDARHLTRLRDTLGDKFIAGAVLHTGPRPYQLGDRIAALPLWCLWA